MPKMDGIETTQKLRELGYKGIIVALTANALVGNDELFAKNGFDGFISKPIDTRLLNAILNKFIRNRYPEEAKKYKSETIMHTETIEINPKLVKIFCRDAEKVIYTLRETVAKGDLKLFTTAAHSMKSALTNIGEKEISEMAAALEKAGIIGNTEYIAAYVESFVETLEDLMKRIRPAKTDDANDEEILEDIALLKEQLRIIKTACEDYSNTPAYTALDRLKEKKWKTETNAMLEKIDILLLHSDFEEIASMIDDLIKT